MRTHAFRPSWKRLFALAAAVTFPALVLVPASAVAQTTSEAVVVVRLDARRVADLTSRSDGQVSVSDLLRQTGSVELRSARGFEVVLHAVHLRRGQVFRSFRSRPFSVSGNTRVALSRVLQPGQPDYSVESLEPDHVLEASKTIRADAALEPGPIDGIFSGMPDGWESMDAFYFVAAPTDERVAAAVEAAAAIAFAVPVPDH